MKLIVSSLFSLVLLTSFIAIPLGISQNFEGKIIIVQTDVVDTLNFEFILKNKLIKINQSNTSGSIEKVYLVDLNDSTVFEINDEKKIFIKYSLRQNSPYLADQEFIEIKKTQNFKYINGYKCFQWLVTNKIKNTAVSYWVAKEDFAYLIGILQNINRSDKKCSYFMFIPDYENFFPFESVERGLLREFRTQDEVISVKAQKIPDKMFEIPKDYHQIHK
jgi:hypothetical protein